MCSLFRTMLYEGGVIVRYRCGVLQVQKWSGSAGQKTKIYLAGKNIGITRLRILSNICYKNATGYSKTISCYVMLM